jgi:hypothetical protein
MSKGSSDKSEAEAALVHLFSAFARQAIVDFEAQLDAEDAPAAQKVGQRSKYERPGPDPFAQDAEVTEAISERRSAALAAWERFNT